MIPVKLQLRGFLSYRELIEIDFSEFELACISGQNGAGKSSLLDAITWVLFGQARRRDDAVINSGQELAEVCLEFDYEGNRYRVLRNKARGKTTVLEFNLRDTDGSWKVLTEHTIGETEKRIERTLRMDYETFINASFFLQGKADQFAQQRPGDRKRILSTILGLEVWETYREGASLKRKINERKLAQVEGQLKEIENELAEESTRRKDLASLEKRLNELGGNRKAKEETLEAQVKRAAELKHFERRVADLLAQLQSARERRDQRALQLEELRQEQADYQHQLSSAPEIEQDYARWQAARKELADMDKVFTRFSALQQQRAPYQLEIQNKSTRLSTELSSLEKRRDEIRNKSSQLPDLERSLAVEKRTLSLIENTISQRETQRVELAALNEERARLDQEYKTLNAAIDELDDRIHRLREAHEETCPLCGSDLSTEERAMLVQKLESEQLEFEQRTKQNQSRLKEIRLSTEKLAAELNKLSDIDAKYRQAQKNIANLEAQLNNIRLSEQDWQQNEANLLAHVEKTLAGELYATDARQRLRELDTQLESLGYNATAHENLRQQELELSGSEARMRDLDKARSALSPLNRQINDLVKELAEDDKHLAAIEASHKEAEEEYQQKAADQPDIQKLEKELQDIKTEENKKRMDVGAARQRVEVLVGQKERHKDLNAERSEINQHIARLKTLERAFGKDGVPALLIEQALPEIESEANQLLDRLSNGAMSVRFATQREYKDAKREDKKETLDIMISDNSNYREYEMYSGGEAFRVNFAIRLALSRVLARRAGARLQTLVIDEGFGSQDADGRQRLIEAINLVRGDFEKILVITHLEELKDAFPARVEVEKGVGGSFLRVMLA